MQRHQLHSWIKGLLTDKEGKTLAIRFPESLRIYSGVDHCQFYIDYSDKTAF